MDAIPAMVNKLESLTQAIPPKQKKKTTVWIADLAGSRFSAQIKPTFRETKMSIFFKRLNTYMVHLVCI